jgi:AraC-like DNA-binding protein
MARQKHFRVELGGPDLPSQMGLYGSGEINCYGSPAVGRQESCHAFQVMGVVVSGHFNFRSPVGAVEATPGALVLGNAMEEFDYSFSDNTGVRKSVVALDRRLVAEVANDCGINDAAFGVAGLRAGRASAPLYAAIRRLAAANAPQEELAVQLAANAIKLGRAPGRLPEIDAERRRMREIADFLDNSFAEPMTLSEMAAMANLSRFHFIRAFRAAMGETPHQYLIGARLRAAADRLLDSAEPITQIAFGVGFNDISHFNATFREAFGTSPTAWRKPCKGVK